MIITERKQKNKHKATSQNKRICIGTKHKGVYIHIHNILYIEAYHNYSWLHLKGGNKILSSKSLKHYENILQATKFVRVHRSHVVNLSYVKAYEKKYRLLYLHGDIMLSISHRRNLSFSEMITNNEYNKTFENVA